MKRILLIIGALVCMAGVANADSGQIQINPFANGQKQNKFAKQQAGANDNIPEDGYLVFGYCNGFYSSLGTTATVPTTVKGAIYIPDTQIAQWGNAKITKLRIGYGECANRNITIFFSEEKEGTPFYTQETTIAKQNSWNEVVLTEAYTLTGKGFYVGYSVDLPAAKVETQTGAVVDGYTGYPVGFDGWPSNNSNAGLFCVNGEWYDIYSDYGSLCIQVVVEGDNLPEYDLMVDEIGFDDSVLLNAPFEAQLSVVNNGSKNISSVTVNAKIADNEYSGLTASVEPAYIAPGEWGIITVEGLKCESEGLAQPIVLTVAKVNDQEDNTPSDNSASGVLDCVEEGFKRNVVVEEWTGTWCGWCPRGIVGMEYMEKTYGDDGFIGIAVHSGNGAQNDPMASTSYSAFITRFAEGFPGCVINRNKDYVIDPNKSDLEYYFNILSKLPAYGKVEMTADLDPTDVSKILINAEATFALDLEVSSTNYRFAFVLTENHVGPYNQTNYYAPAYGQGLQLDGWEKKGASVSTYYDHVGRVINTVWGISGSVPGSIKKGETYKWEASLPTTNITNIDECEVVTLLLDNSTRKIVNAAKFKMQDSAVEGIEAESRVKISTLPGAILINGNAGCEVFSVDGKTVAHSLEEKIEVPAGIYIVKARDINGGEATKKVIVK